MSVVGQNILAGASGAGDYTIDQSLRFSVDDSAYLSKTPGSAGNQKTWTLSFWYKRTDMGNYESGDPYIFGGGIGTTPVTPIGIDTVSYTHLTLPTKA